MNDGKYNEGEPQQEIVVTVRFKVKHNPATEGHKQQLCLSYFPPKGVPIRLENGQLIIEVWVGIRSYMTFTFAGGV